LVDEFSIKNLFSPLIDERNINERKKSIIKIDFGIKIKLFFVNKTKSAYIKYIAI
jgi:hypothetical protein